MHASRQKFLFIICSYFIYLNNAREFELNPAIFHLVTFSPYTIRYIIFCRGNYGMTGA